MNYSQTYLAVIVSVLGWVLKAAGVPFVEEELVKQIGSVLELAGLLWVLVRRFRDGDVKWFGARK